MIHPFLTARKVKRSETWPITDAEIVESEVKAIGAKKRTHRAKIKYRYTVGGEEYTGRRVAIGGEVNSAARSRAEERTVKYPLGSNQVVFYNPDKPQEAYLERNQEGAMFVFLGGAFFCLLGLAILTGLIPTQW